MIIKNTSEKIYLRIVPKSYGNNVSTHYYVFERWKGDVFGRMGSFNRVQYETDNKYEVKIMMMLFGMNNIKRYRIYHHFDSTVSDCLIEFED